LDLVSTIRDVTSADRRTWTDPDARELVTATNPDAGQLVTATDPDAGEGAGLMSAADSDPGKTCKRQKDTSQTHDVRLHSLTLLQKVASKRADSSAPGHRPRSCNFP
jgi:hypothetical protein